MEFYRCDSPDCDFVTDDPNLEVCPHCGGTMFIPVEEDYISGHGWLCLSDAALDAGDEGRALQYLERAARDDYPYGFFRLGMCHLRGDLGLEPSVETAMSCFRKVEELDDPAGWCAVGQLYQRGD